MMRRISYVVAALLAASALPATAERPPVARPALDWAPAAAARAHERFARDPGTETYHAAFRAGLENAGLTPAPVQGVGVIAEPVGDLDGDRLGDLVEIAHDRAAGTATLRARRGVDGRLLWTRSTPGFPYVAGAKLGTTGTDGVLVVSAGYESTAAGEVVTVTVTALDARGTVLWEQSFRGLLADTNAAFGAVGLPEITGLFDALAGPAEELLVTLYDFAFSQAGVSGAASTFVLDGATGRATPVGATDVAADGIPYAVGVPDLSGDRLGDVLVATPPTGPSAPRLTAYEATGVPKWVRTDLDFFMFSAVGDVTGDGRHDLGVSAEDASGYELQVVSGADGTTVSKAAGEFAYPLGDVDRDGRADFGTVDVVLGQNMGIAFRAFRGDGRRLYERQMTRPMGGNGGVGALSAGPVGDVQPDGVGDLAYTVSVASFGGPSGSSGGVVDGRTGGLVHARPTDQPLYDAVDARGTDFGLTAFPKPGVLTIAAQQGSTGAVLWQSTLRHPAISGKGGQLRAARLDGDPCADLLVTVPAGGNALLLAIRGRDGRLMWAREITTAGERAYGALAPGRDGNRGC